VAPRGAWTACATFVVAIVVALAVPISQLQTTTIVTECCCPDPSNCHCPDHKPDHSGQPMLRACHRTKHELVAPQAPSFTSPQIAIAIAPPRVAPAAIVAPPALHESPVVDEPYGPS